MAVSKRKKQVQIKTAPVANKDGIPYDYLVVIDSGSKGSRVYVYNWLNPQHALEAGIDLSLGPRLNLVREFTRDKSGEGKEDQDQDTDSDTDSDAESDLEPNDKSGSVRFPKIHSGKKWHHKMTPGISSFNQSPQKVGNHHLSYLLSLASVVVPKSEHSRTPIFLHATAGMRILPPNEQEPILENVCLYFSSNSDFYIPDCKSHVNIIDGDVEGLYGWLSINYMLGAFDHPEDHQHGKNHSTYGLLDMGGASTQVVFLPNSTEAAEHNNNLYKITLSALPQLANSDKREDTIGNYLLPELKEYDVYSDSFLGFGMFQARNKYRKFLLDDYRKAQDLPEDAYRFRTPISDPCLPKGFTTTDEINSHNLDFIGESNFEGCLKSIFPVLSNATHTSGTGKFEGDCQQLSETSRVSSCLLNQFIPSFDFDINHFVGVSGYWDALNKLLSTDTNPSKDEYTEKYDYNVIYKKTKELCSQPLKELLQLNHLKTKKERLKEDELAELCFKSSWILNFLHVGLGFPRFGIDEVPNKDEKFKSLELVEKVGGSSFSWTMGRAILYANDEYAQAFNNYTLKVRGENKDPIPRPGYLFSAAEGSFYYGAEPLGVPPRPLYTPAVEGATYPHFDYEKNFKDGSELKWYIQPHRFYGEVIFVLLIAGTIFLMMGRSGRSLIIQRLFDKVSNVKRMVLAKFGVHNGAYLSVAGEENTLPNFELEDLPSSAKSSTNDDEQFTIDSEEEV
ncbi:CIC11C00000002143 [Sungouiella intermedia]|uniref:CIC11C00000002143 n=1 Tax=Sungouiella intermedia TaxID=45354 RepID=A0A1L0DVU3_9ASCO|nr:CIC11C00000002143 [[Candida] intermedia]